MGLRVYAYLRPVLRHGEKFFALSADLAGLEQPKTAKARNRDRVLTDDELCVLLPLVRAKAEAGDSYAAATLFLIYSAQRVEEVGGSDRNPDRGLRFGDLGAGGVWTQTVNKAERRHSITLPTQALDLVELRRIHLADEAKKTARVFGTRTGGHLSNWDRWQKQQINPALSFHDWQRHDLRRTASTIMAKLGVDAHVIEVALNHAQPTGSGLAATYNRYGYAKEAGEALALLADHLTGLEHGGAEVFSLDTNVRR